MAIIYLFRWQIILFPTRETLKWVYPIQMIGLDVCCESHNVSLTSILIVEKLIS